jgi:4a-hydroxytetrahydrobiopterin dehydratase
MDKRRKLDAEALQAALARHPAWQRDGACIRREFRFPSFAEAFGFMAAVALHAERLEHHPDWSNSYNKVSIALTTHATGGLSALDFELAACIDTLYQGD